ncbi:MAG: hypothetical protein R2772_07185 [Chitinophagales bacterium]
MKKLILALAILFQTGSLFSQTFVNIYLAHGEIESYNISEINEIRYYNTNEGSYNLNINQDGPAGGLVFYDKGYYSEGWRYMEAKIIGTGTYDGQAVFGTLDEIGSAKRNTYLALNQWTSTSAAARLVANYSVFKNGVLYDDWYLPSIDELFTVESSGVGAYLGMGEAISSTVDFPNDVYGIRFDGLITTFSIDANKTIVGIRYF